SHPYSPPTYPQLFPYPHSQSHTSIILSLSSFPIPYTHNPFSLLIITHIYLYIPIILSLSSFSPLSTIHIPTTLSLSSFLISHTNNPFPILILTYIYLHTPTILSLSSFSH